MEHGKVPSILKEAKIVPIYKAEHKDEIGNYRPISLLSCISKVLEKVVENQIRKFADDNKIFYKHQYGFRKGHQTQHALIDLTSLINDAKSKNKE